VNLAEFLAALQIKGIARSVTLTHEGLSPDVRGSDIYKMTISDAHGVVQQPGGFLSVERRNGLVTFYRPDDEARHGLVEAIRKVLA
jgi:hypothetical protein